MIIQKSHSDPLTRGQSSATYFVFVTNEDVVDWTDPTVVTEVLPTGLTLVGMEGDGWDCTDNVCTRSDTLLAGDSFPTITVTVNVELDAPDEVINSVELASDVLITSTTDSTTIVSGLSVPPRTPTRWSLHKFEIRPRSEERG